jgi:hypothetical protein
MEGKDVKLHQLLDLCFAIKIFDLWNPLPKLMFSIVPLTTWNWHTHELNYDMKMTSYLNMTNSTITFINFELVIDSKPYWYFCHWKCVAWNCIFAIWDTPFRNWITILNLKLKCALLNMFMCVEMVSCYLNSNGESMHVLP